MQAFLGLRVMGWIGGGNATAAGGRGQWSKHLNQLRLWIAVHQFACWCYSSVSHRLQYTWPDPHLWVFIGVSQKYLWCWLLRWIAWTHMISTWTLAAGTRRLQFLSSLVQCCCWGSTYTATSLGFPSIEPKLFFNFFSFFFLSTDLAITKPISSIRSWELRD